VSLRAGDWLGAWACDFVLARSVPWRGRGARFFIYCVALCCRGEMWCGRCVMVDVRECGGATGVVVARIDMQVRGGD
jgi:hypothetical protein